MSRHFYIYAVLLPDGKLDADILSTETDLLEGDTDGNVEATLRAILEDNGVDLKEGCRYVFKDVSSDFLKGL